MCLVTLQKEPLIAGDDIVVFKLLETDGVTSLHRRYLYEIGKLYKTEFGLGAKHFIPTDIVADAWVQKTFKTAKLIYSLNNVYYRSNTLPGATVISQGYHSYVNADRADLHSWGDNPPVLREATIPAGSEYYMDATGLLVSNQIIIKEIVK